MKPEIVIHLNARRKRGDATPESLLLEDTRLHALNTFLDALDEGMSSPPGQDKLRFDSASATMFSTITRRMGEQRSSGELFSLDISSVVDPASSKVTWTFDFRSDLQKPK